MPRRTSMKKDKAVSPVIATIILVAVAIVMSIAVAYWALGLGGIFTRYEKIEIMALYPHVVATDHWNLTAKLKNTGSAPATINMILVNGKPYDVYKTGEKPVVKIKVGNEEFDPNKGVTLSPGTEGVFYVWINKTSPFTPGMTVEITFHTAAGSDYPKTIVLP